MPSAPAQHILAYVETLDGGGVERALFGLTREWLAAGRRVTLAIGDANGPLSAELPPGAEVVPLHGVGTRAARALPDVIRQQAPDCLFCPGNHYTAVAAWVRLCLGRATPPTVAKMSNALRRGDHGAGLAAANRAWLRLHPMFLDHVVAMTPAMATETIAAMRIDPARVSVIPNPPAWHPPAEAPPLPDGRFILGVGRLEPQKRWDRLIAALPRIADPEVHLLLLGEGTQRRRLEALVAALGLEARVHLPGHALDPMPAIRRAEVAVLTSDYEGVPGVLREALSVGTPVIATDASAAIAEIITTSLQGTIVRRDDPAELVAALNHWTRPDTVRPMPTPQPGEDSAARYLDLFDALVTRRKAT